MTPSTALALGIGTGIAVDPTLRALCGNYAGLVGLAMVLGACVAWWRERRGA